MSDDGYGEVLFVGMLLGAFISCMVTIAIVSTHEDHSWETEALARGYAHYELDHSFHWNNERK
jgi:hypothetical protein